MIRIEKKTQAGTFVRGTMLHTLFTRHIAYRILEKNQEGDHSGF
jgi:hypothetical protein